MRLRTWRFLFTGMLHAGLSIGITSRLSVQTSLTEVQLILCRFLLFLYSQRNFLLFLVLSLVTFLLISYPIFILLIVRSIMTTQLQTTLPIARSTIGP
jgi:hypothetical protein